MDSTTNFLASPIALHAWFNLWAWVANLVVIVVVLTIRRRDRSKFKPTDFVILNLAATDFVYSFADSVATMSVGGDLTRLSRSNCEALAFFTGFCPISSIGDIVLLAYLRYRILTHTPDRPKLTFRTVMKLQCVIWVLALAYPTLYLSTGILFQTTSFCHHLLGLSTPAIAATTIYTAILTIVPPFTVLFFYAKGYREAVVAERMVKAEHQASRVVARMGLTVLVFYCVTILPWSSSVVYIMIAGENAVISEETSIALALIYVLSFGLNPVIYFAFLKTYRDMLFSLLHCRMPRMLSKYSTAARSNAAVHSSEKNGCKSSVNTSFATDAEAVTVDVGSRTTFSGTATMSRPNSPSLRHAAFTISRPNSPSVRNTAPEDTAAGVNMPDSPSVRHKNQAPEDTAAATMSRPGPASQAQLEDVQLETVSV